MVTTTLKPDWTAQDVKALVILIVLSVVLAILPNFATLIRHGTLEYLPDTNEIDYLLVSRPPYYGEARLRDPYSGYWEKLPSIYSWAQFVPFAKLTRWLGLPLIFTGLVWRVLGGGLFALSLYSLFRKLFGGLQSRRAWAFVCAVICLSDAGFILGRCLIEDSVLLRHLWEGTTPLPVANFLVQYRAVTPILNLPFLLLLVAQLIPSRSLNFRDICLAVLFLGICIFLYFFFWTAALLGISLYCLWQVGEGVRRPELRESSIRKARVLFVILLLGMAFGAVQIYTHAQTWGDPKYKAILERLARGLHLPSDDPNRFGNLMNYWVWLKLAVGGLGIFGFGLKVLVPLWCFTLAGYGLANSAIVTGIEFENWHWSFVHAPIGEIMVLSTLVLLIPRIFPRGQKFFLPLVGSFAGLLLLVALIWRPYEALHAPIARVLSVWLSQFRPLHQSLGQLGRDCSLAGPPASDVALLFSQSARLYDYPSTSHGSMIPDDEVHERHVLNGWLQGLDVKTYLQTVNGLFQGGGFSSERPEWQIENIKAMRTTLFDQFLVERPENRLQRYRAFCLILPRAMTPTRGGPWKSLNRTDKWAIWVRPTSEVLRPR